MEPISCSANTPRKQLKKSASTGPKRAVDEIMQLGGKVIAMHALWANMTCFFVFIYRVLRPL